MGRNSGLTGTVLTEIIVSALLQVNTAGEDRGEFKIILPMSAAPGTGWTYRPGLDEDGGPAW